MSEFFLNIVNMSISASWIVLAVLLLRLLLKKAPKWITVLLWGIVAVRLICPFTFESVMSLIPSAETISPNIMTEKVPEINTGIPILNNTINPVISGSISPDPSAGANPLQIWIPILSVVWITGIVLLLAYTAISYWRVKQKIGTAVLLRGNIYQSETVVSPFVLGIIKPKIYLPFNISEQDTEHVIAHEQAHIRRKDHLWKPLGFLLLTLHWFNPLMWLGYVLLCRDIELACDEKVIEEMNTEQRADYSQALLTCSVNRRVIAACPLAFGEVGVKDRVKSVLNYKKPAFWIILTAIVASIVAAVCFLTNPKTTLDDELSMFLDGRICEHHYSEGHTDKHFVVVNHKVLGVGHSSDQTTVYLWVLYHEYGYENGKIQLKSGAHIPTVITAKRTDKHGHYELVEYWEPRDGTDYAKDIREKFPWYLHGKALDSQRYIQEQLEFCENAAKEYFSSVSNVGGGGDSSNTVSSDDVEPPKDSFNKDTAIASVLGEKYRAEKPDGLLHIQSCYLLANETVSGTPLQGNSGHMEKATFYLLVYHMKYSVNGGQLEEVDGGFVPTAITFAISENGEYSLEEYWTPRVGADYEKDIRAKFPRAAADDALNIEKYAESLKNDNRNKATEALNNL